MRSAVRSIVVLLMVALSATASAGSEAVRIGSEFLDDARTYDGKAVIAMQRAARSSGETAGVHISLARVYRRMAAIKRRAAELAKANRWDEIRWDEYHALESKRDALAASPGEAGRVKPKQKPERSA